MTSTTPAASPTLTAFAGLHRIASGTRRELLAQLRASPQPPDILLRVFNDTTGERLDFDLRPDAVDNIDNDAADIPPPAEPEMPATRAVGRPKLGVVAREVTLLPRHWEWLSRQSGGASVALRKLVEEARKSNEARDTARSAREAAYRFMTEMGGDFPDFEEASRALFAGDRARFESLVEPWPEDVRTYLVKLADASWYGA
ncbi:DUF2239 family protein [Polaromonas aquatica]|uniref:DUF2239 family protein n=1 Tax=Polaromonas aquatica TaxID=332657 RepID=UPI003D6622D6